jgi:adenosylcobinamide-GDP ribazoletransferase
MSRAPGLFAQVLPRLDEARLALMLLTRLPMGRIAKPPQLSACVWAYPLAGIVVGLIGGGVFGLTLWLGLNGLIAAILAVSAGVLVTGGMHEDGLADLADGLGGGATRDRKLEIMRDSRIGSYGAIALVLALSLRVAALAGVHGAQHGMLALVGLAALSRAVLPVVMAALPQARKSGLGAEAAARTAASRVAVSVATGVLIAALALPSPLWVCGAMAIAAALMAGLALRQLGGFTGDVLGATQIIAELAAWLVLAAHGAI